MIEEILKKIKKLKTDTLYTYRAIGGSDDRTRVYVSRLADRGVIVKAGRGCFYKPSRKFPVKPSAKRIPLDKSLFAKTIAIIRILLKKLPYLSLNTSGLSKDYIQIAIENGVNDLGIVSLPEMKTLSPFFVGNLDSSDAEALITRLNRVPQIRTASFLNHPGK